MSHMPLSSNNNEKFERMMNALNYAEMINRSNDSDVLLGSFQFDQDSFNSEALHNDNFNNSWSSVDSKSSMHYDYIENPLEASTSMDNPDEIDKQANAHKLEQADNTNETASIERNAPPPSSSNTVPTTQNSKTTILSVTDNDDPKILSHHFPPQESHEQYLNTLKTIDTSGESDDEEKQMELKEDLKGELKEEINSRRCIVKSKSEQEIVKAKPVKRQKSVRSKSTQRRSNKASNQSSPRSLRGTMQGTVRSSSRSSERKTTNFMKGTISTKTSDEISTHIHNLEANLESSKARKRKYRKTSSMSMSKFPHPFVENGSLSARLSGLSSRFGEKDELLRSQFQTSTRLLSQSLSLDRPNSARAYSYQPRYYDETPHSARTSVVPADFSSFNRHSTRYRVQDSSGYGMITHTPRKSVVQIINDPLPNFKHLESNYSRVITKPPPSKVKIQNNPLPSYTHVTPTVPTHKCLPPKKGGKQSKKRIFTEHLSWDYIDPVVHPRVISHKPAKSKVKIYDDKTLHARMQQVKNVVPSKVVTHKPLKRKLNLMMNHCYRDELEKYRGVERDIL